MNSFELQNGRELTKPEYFQEANQCDEKILLVNYD